MRELIAYSYCLAFVALTNAARCPETKKAHPTSCTLFYNCVNLPNDGYVWVPSKCADGLVFQPHLRLCVLPGKAWTCDPTSDRKEDLEFEDQDEGSSQGLMQESLDLSEYLDTPVTGDRVTPATTPYSSIDIDEATEDTQIDSITEQKEQHSCEHKTNNVEPTKETYNILRQLVRQLLIFKQITIPLEAFASAFTTPANSPESPEAVELPTKNQHVLTNYLIQNYIQQNNLQTTVIASSNPVTTPGSTVEHINTSAGNVNDPSTGLSITDSNTEHNIVLIIDSLGNRRYLTVEKYKMQAQYLNPQFTVLVPCIKNIRLPNETDCTRYYTCDPDIPLVFEYSCPQNTGFNKYSRLCDQDTRNACLERNVKDPTGSEGMYASKIRPKRICEEVGKMKDPSSDSHYFICYVPNQGAEIKSMRMACPNGLIFCQNKKVCTTRRLCTTV